MGEKFSKIKSRIDNYIETHIVAFKGFDKNDIKKYIEDLEKIHDYLESHQGFKAYKIAKHLGVKSTAIRRKLVVGVEIEILRIDKKPDEINPGKPEYYALELE